MTDNQDRLYELLPVIHRQRDAEEGWPLRALLRVIAEQVNLVEADIGRLYDNWFIETSEEWVVPYIGDLVGYRIVHEAGQPGDVNTAQGRLRNKFLIPRREVANTIGYRRRKGTLYLLELLANQVAGWPARAVEFYRLLARTRALNHQRPNCSRTVDLRDAEALYNLDGPFDRQAHSVDVRHINSHRTIGRYNIPSVGLFVWRLKTYPISQAPAYCLEEVDTRCFTFSVLSNDTPLYTKWTAEADPTDIAGEMNLPIPISRRAFEVQRSGRSGQANSAYYGVDKSLAIWAPGWHENDAETPVPAENIVPADLTDWHYRPSRGSIALDPELGRFAFHPDDEPDEGVWVSYHYGFSHEMGSGEYHRLLSQPDDVTLYQVGKNGDWSYDSLGKALDAWSSEDNPPEHAVIEIQDGSVYVEQLTIRFKENKKQTLQIRAANGRRPMIRLLDMYPSRQDSMRVQGQPGCRLTLDGLLIAGRGVRLEGPLAEATFHHCTLVPGWWLDNDCNPWRANEPSLILKNTNACINIHHSIIGSIVVNLDEVARDPLSISLFDSILDATEPELDVLTAPGRRFAHAALTVKRCTVLGRIRTHAIILAENSIFDGPVKVARRQQGCIRFCYVMPKSRTPRRYRCQPDLVEAAERDKHIHEDVLKKAIVQEQRRVRPRFNSVRYGTPTYCQLALTCAEEIRRGADDESEMGAFHDLFQPQREANLRARLEEYAPAGMDAGIIFTS